MALLNKSLALFCLSLLVGAQALAVEVSFPADELPNEVVVPVLDSREPVKSRLVKLSGRFSVSGGVGWLLDEPFYQNRFLSVGVLYHHSEKIGFGLSYLSIGAGLSDYGNQFGQTLNKLDFTKAPSLKSAMTAVFHYSFMYGKISWNKEKITPVTYYSSTELSWANYGSKNLPWLATGIGQRIFIQKNWGTDLTMKLMYRQQIDPLSKNISNTSSPTLTADDFGTKSKIGADIRLGAFYLF